MSYINPFMISRHLNPRSSGLIVFGGGGGGDPAPAPAAPAALAPLASATLLPADGGVMPTRADMADGINSDSKFPPPGVDPTIAWARNLRLPTEEEKAATKLAWEKQDDVAAMAAYKVALGAAETSTPTEGLDSIGVLRQQLSAVTAVPKPIVNHNPEQVAAAFDVYNTKLQGKLQSAAQQASEQVASGQRELVNTAITEPTNLATPQTVQAIDPNAAGASIAVGTGQTGALPTAPTFISGTPAAAVTPADITTSTMQAATSQPAVTQATQATTAAQGQLTPQAILEGQQGTLSPEAIAAKLQVSAEYVKEVQAGTRTVSPDEIAKAAETLNIPEAQVAQMLKPYTDAEAAKFSGTTPQAEAQDQYNLPPSQYATMANTKVEDAAKVSVYPTEEAAQSGYESTLQAAQGTVGASELASAKDIIGAEKAIQATAATMEAVNEAAIATAARGSFSQDQLASAAVGTVPPSATIQGQLSNLMNQFNNGTPAWAAGAMRAANASMNARGLGSSSMAGAAIVQATMEAALPIAAQDAQVFQQMNMANLSNRQQVSLANAAASQNMELVNLNNTQQVALQNSSQAFNLQSQNLSNEQSVVIANAQFKASLQNKTLDIKTQTSLANASKYAEMNKINLSNLQQVAITRSSENLQVEMTNLSNEQQTALSNLQVRAALVGQELNNEQQVSVLTSQQSFQTANFNASTKQAAFMQDASAQAALEGRAMDARQQTQLFNVSKQMEERNIELNNEQQTLLFNATQRTNIDMAELSNRQQTNLANAQIQATIEGKELDNRQQVAVLNSAKFAEANNMTFTIAEQAKLQNSELMKTVGLANLNASQASTLQNAAATASMDMTNLSNQQQAAVQNAQSFLQMDMTNLNNQQQTEMFKSQSVIQSIFTDQAAENASKQFNASNENQTKQFLSNMRAQVNQFNASQSNAMSQFNVSETNAMAKFNTDMRNQRDQFNSTNQLVIAQANAQWRQNVATTNTTAQNVANAETAKVSNAFTASTIDQIWQRERDMMSMAWKSSESAGDRANNILVTQMSVDAQKDALALQAEASEDAAKGSLVSNLLFWGITGKSRD